MRVGDFKDEYTLTWPTVATSGVGATCTGDTVIDCRKAKRICVQVDQAATTNPGAATDVKFYTRPEGSSTYDTTAYSTIGTVGSAEVRTATINAGGFAYMKVKVNNVSTTALCSPKVVVQVVSD